MRRRLGSPDPKVSAMVAKAARDIDEKRVFTDRRIGEIQGRLEAVEDELGMDNALSMSLSNTDIDWCELSEMWHAAGKVSTLKAVDDELAAWSDAVT